jgi:hypothetical protein
MTKCFMTGLEGKAFRVISSYLRSASCIVIIVCFVEDFYSECKILCFGFERWCVVDPSEVSLLQVVVLRHRSGVFQVG